MRLGPIPICRQKVAVLANCLACPTDLHSFVSKFLAASFPTCDYGPMYGSEGRAGNGFRGAAETIGQNNALSAAKPRSLVSMRFCRNRTTFWRPIGVWVKAIGLGRRRTSRHLRKRVAAEAADCLKRRFRTRILTQTPIGRHPEVVFQQNLREPSGARADSGLSTDPTRQLVR